MHLKISWYNFVYFLFFFLIVSCTQESSSSGDDSSGAGGSNGSIGGETPSTLGVTVSPGTTVFSENGGTGNFKVVLNTKPNADVVLEISSPDESEAKIGQVEASDVVISLTFTPNNWNIPQSVNLIGQDDQIPDGNQVFNISVNINSDLTTDTSEYASLTAPQVNDVSIIVQDDDKVGITIEKIATTVSEAEGPGSFSVV